MTEYDKMGIAVEVPEGKRMYSSDVYRLIAPEKCCLFCAHCSDVFYDSHGPYMFMCELEEVAGNGQGWETCGKFEDDGTPRRTEKPAQEEIEKFLAELREREKQRERLFPIPVVPEESQNIIDAVIGKTIPVTGDDVAEVEV